LFKYLFVVFGLLPLALQSQTSHETDENKLNIKYLEHLLKQEIDSVRQSKGLDVLINDSILYLASEDQSKYLSTKKELTHFQKENPDKYSPQNRADYYGAVNFRVGENILFTSFYSPTGNQSVIDSDIYKEMAHSMMLLWVHSPGHYANIVTRDYDITGVSVYYDKKTNRLFAAQDFAKVNPYYKYKNCPSFFPYEKYNDDLVNKKFISNKVEIAAHKKHAFKIKRDNRKKTCCSDEKTVVFNSLSVMLSSRDDTLYLGILKRYFAPIHQFFKNKKDGLLLEFLDFDYTYSCNLLDNTRIPTRDNGGCIFNGPITKPVYKDSVLYYMDKNKKHYTKHNDFIYVPLGKYPEKLKGKKVDINLLILQKNRLCKVMPSQGICGILMEPDIPLFNLTLDLDSIKYRPYVKVQKNEFKVFFNKNDINIINPDTLYFLKNLLKKRDLFVSKIILNAYASVEGSYEINQFLYTKRAENILKVFQSEQDSAIDLTTHTEENWKMFFDQLKTSKYAYLSGLDTCQIKDSVNVPETALKLESLLAQQRYGQVEIFYKPIINNQNIDEFAFSEYKKMCQLKKLDMSQNLKLKNITSFLLYRCLKDKITLDSIEAYLKEGKKWPEITHQVLLFKIKYRKELYLHPDTTYKLLNGYYTKNDKDKIAGYNCLAYLFNTRSAMQKKPEISDIQAFLNLLKDKKVQEDTLEAFELYYNFKYLNYVYSKGWTYKSVQKSLDFIKDFYIKNPPNDDLSYQLALYFITFGQFQTSLDYLEPLISEAHFKKEAFILYLKVYDQLQIAGLKNNSEELLAEAADKLSTIDWCNLFIGPCNIRFQIFDNNVLRKMYCEKCNIK